MEVGYYKYYIFSLSPIKTSSLVLVFGLYGLPVSFPVFVFDMPSLEDLFSVLSLDSIMFGNDHQSSAVTV